MQASFCKPSLSIRVSLGLLLYRVRGDIALALMIDVVAMLLIRKFAIANIFEMA